MATYKINGKIGWVDEDDIESAGVKSALTSIR